MDKFPLKPQPNFQMNIILAYDKMSKAYFPSLIKQDSIVFENNIYESCHPLIPEWKMVIGAAQSTKEKPKQEADNFDFELISSEDVNKSITLKDIPEENDVSNQIDIIIRCLESFIKNSIVIFALESFDIPLVKKILLSISKSLNCYEALPYLIFMYKEEGNIAIPPKFLAEDQKQNCIYDYRDIALLPLSQDKEKDIENLYIKIIHRCLYYNQLGEEFKYKNLFISNDMMMTEEKGFSVVENAIKDSLFKAANQINNIKYEMSINFMVVGRIASGKSYFINSLLGDKRCKEGKGGKVTTQIINYKNKDYPISFYDTPGYEDNFAVEVNHFLEKILKAYDHSIFVHCVFFMINVQGRLLVSSDKELIDVFKKRGIEIFFIMTKGSSDHQIRDCIDEIKSSINKYYPYLPYEDRIFVFKENFSKQKNYANDMPNLFNKLALMFDKHKIPETTMQECIAEKNPLDKQYLEKSIELFKQSIFFPYYYSKNKNKEKQKANSIISSKQKEKRKRIIDNYTIYYSQYNDVVEKFKLFALKRFMVENL